MKALRPLTPKQQDILEFIHSFLDDNGYSPSLEEIAGQFELAISTVHQHIDLITKKGFLYKDHFQSRGISTPRYSTDVTHIPKLGIIAAGSPIEPIENPEMIAIPASIKFDKRVPHYALEVQGVSMKDMGIFSGDIVLIKHQNIAENGDVVVAITEEGATLKVYRNTNGRITLEPKNMDYPIIVPKELEIRGKFVGLIRQECY